jgi:hypothetical protein
MPDSSRLTPSPACRWLWPMVVAIALTVVLLVPAAADARRTIRVESESTREIRGDVLWMRIAGRGGELLAPFAIDSKGGWCWAPASVFEESCTMTVSRRRHGRRTLTNGSGVAVRVTYTRRW